MTSTQWVAGEADATTATPSEPSTTTTQATTSKKAPAADAWKDEYAWVLDHPSDYSVNSAARYDPVGTYHYALVEMTGDSTPELLLMVDSKEYSPIIVFTIGSDGKAVASTDVLIAGASGAGGSRARLEASEDGQGIYQVDSHSVQPDAYAKLYKLSGRSIKAVTDSIKFQNTDLQPGHRYVTWAPASDRSALNAGKLTYDEATRFSDYTPFPSKADPKPETATAPTDGDENVVTDGAVAGTVRDLSGEELAALAGDFQYSPSERFLVLYLDETTSIAGKRGVETSLSVVPTRTVLLGTKSSGANFKLAGRRILLWLDSDTTRFANDPAAPYTTAIVPPSDAFDFLD